MEEHIERQLFHSFEFGRSRIDDNCAVLYKLKSIILLLYSMLALFTGCASEDLNAPDNNAKIPEHDKRYGIYRLDPITKGIELIYSSDNKLHRIHENPAGTRLIFREDFGDDVFHDSEICMINTPAGTGTFSR